MGTKSPRSASVIVLVTVLVTVGTLATVPGPPATAAHLGPVDIMSTVAGTAGGGFNSYRPEHDGGPSTQATLNHPAGVARDPAGNLYIADEVNYRVRKVDTSSVITTVAGNGQLAYSGDGGAATSAALGNVPDVAVDGRGGLFVATQGQIEFGRVVMAFAVRRVDLASGTITTVAGNGELGDTGDGGSPTAARVNPVALAVDHAGNLLVAQENRVRRVWTGDDGIVNGGPDEVITTVAGGGAEDVLVSRGDGGPATQAYLASVGDVVVAARSLYIADAERVRRVPAGADGAVDGDQDEIITTVAGIVEDEIVNRGPSNGDGGPATKARISGASGIAIDRSGALYVSDRGVRRVRRVSPGADGIVDGGRDANGNPDVNDVETINPAAGAGVSGFDGDGGPALEARFATPGKLEVDPGGSVYVTDTHNHRIRRFGPDLLALGTAESFDPAAVGGPFTYTLSVINHSAGPANAVALTDTLPTGVTFRSATPSQGTCKAAGAKVTCDLRRLDAGMRATVALTVVAPAHSTTVTNRASVSAKESDPFPLSNVNVEPTRVLPEANLLLTATESADPVAAGAPLTYTATVRNAGPGPATAVVLTDTLPPDASFNSASATQGSCRAAKGVLTCELGNLANDATATVALTVGAPATPALLVSTAAVRAYEADLTPAADTDHTVVTATGAPGVGVAIADAPDPIRVGNGPITYSLAAAYGGPGAASGATVIDALPPELSFVSASASQGTCTHSGGRVSCALGTLGPDSPARVTVVAIPKGPGELTNAATVTATGLEAHTARTTTQVSHPDCGKAVSKNTTLKADIGPCAGTGVIVTKDGITLDLAGYRIFGFPGPGDGNGAGVLVPGRTGVTVRDGVIEHLDAGVAVLGGGANTVDRLDIRHNVGPGPDVAFLGDGVVIIDSPANRVTNNTIVGNGIYDGIGVLGPDSDWTVIEDNTVEGTLGPAQPIAQSGQGIYTNTAAFGPVDGRTVEGSSIARNIVRGNASGGIANLSNVNGRIVDNVVVANGMTNAAGNGIGIQAGPAMDANGTGMLIQGNQVHKNAWSGIIINSEKAGGNRILDNDAADNAKDPSLDGLFHFDLYDDHPACGDPSNPNTWRGNKWGDGFFAPACTGAFGSGPTPTTPSQVSGASEVAPPIRPRPERFSFVVPKEEIS